MGARDRSGECADGLAEDLARAGVVDTHYHVGPELIPRRYDVETLAAAAKPWGATLVLKNHTYATTPLAALARAKYGARFIGSIVLNRFVGGINVDAVIGALSGNRTIVNGEPGEPSEPSEPPIVVWMPTVHAASHLRTFGHAFDPRWSGCCAHSHDPPETKTGGHETSAARASTKEVAVEVFDEALRPLPTTVALLELLAQRQCRLATGHLSADEIMRLVPLALEIGVPGVIVTHPHYPSNEISDDQLRTLVRDPHGRVFIEHCFAIHTIEGVALERMVASIRATGPEQVILATDFGQVVSDPFPAGTVRYAREIEARLDAFSRREVVAMFSDVGLRALGLTKQFMNRKKTRSDNEFSGSGSAAANGANANGARANA